ncbi:hypothetical protein ABPG77_009176 [Micractinium sp. CCAP 211/92]
MLAAAPLCSAAGQTRRVGLCACQGRSTAAAFVQSPRCPSRQRRCVTVCAGASGGSSDDQPPSGSLIPDTLPVASADSDWRAFRAQLVAAAAASEAAPAAAGAGADAAAPASSARSDGAWAHMLRGPEQGCLLVASPLMFQTSQTYFYLAVILLVHHNESGSWGLILNRPTVHKVGDLQESEAGFLQPEFNDCAMHLGGDVDPSSIFLLHSVPGLPGSQEVIPGLYVGGFNEARRGLKEGRYSADQFMVLTRYAGWGAGQLEMECRRGVWVPVSASASAMLCHQARGERQPDGLWHHIAKLVGGEMGQLSDEVRGIAYPEIEAAAKGSYAPAEPEEDDGSGSSEGGGSGGGGAGGSGPQRPHRRSKLPEMDWRDGAGI